MRLGVAGWPVGHSRSPQMQDAALRAAGLSDWRYDRLPIPPERFAETVRALPALGYRAINVTIPHKEPALALAAQASARARAIGAANTLVFDGDGGIAADNTDAPALIEALPPAATRMRALVLGAGGSSRAAVWALRAAGVPEVWVWSRRPQQAAELCAALGGTPTRRPQSVSAELLVNCTAVGLRADREAGDSAELAALPIGPGGPARFAAVVDFVYREGGTALVRAARAAGVPAVDGLELLVAQGALSFEQFTGRAASRDAMRAAVGLPARGSLRR